MNRILVKAMGARPAPVPAPVPVAASRPIYQPSGVIEVKAARPADDHPPAYPGTNTGHKNHRQPPTLEISEFAISGSAKNLT